MSRWFGQGKNNRPQRQMYSQQVQRQGLTKKQKRAQIFLEQTKDAMIIVGNYVRAIASGDAERAKGANLFATSSLNLMQDTAQQLRKDQDLDTLRMGLAEVRESAVKIKAEHEHWIQSSEEVGSAFEHCFGYLEAALSGEDVPILASSATVSDDPAAWNGVLGRLLLAQHDMDRFERSLDEDPDSVKREQQRLVAISEELPRQAQGYDVSVLTRYYETSRSHPDSETEETGSRSHGRTEMDVDVKQNREDGFDWIRGLVLGSPLQVRDQNRRVFDCQVIGVHREGFVRVYVSTLRKEVEVAFDQVVEPFSMPNLG